LSLFDDKAGSWILREGADVQKIKAEIAAMEYDFFRLGGSYKSLSNRSPNWGVTQWVDGKPVIRLGPGHSYGTLVEELYHVQQIQRLRLEYFQKFKRMPKGDVLDAIIKSRGLKKQWERDAAQILDQLGFDRLIIGG
jgi:hypothetical protein